MGQDRLLFILRWVIAPVAIAAITGYYETRVRGAKQQTRASYDTLAPSILELQEKVATLTGRVEELSRRPGVPCPEPVVSKAAGKSAPSVSKSHSAPKVEAHAPTLSDLLGSGKAEPMIDAAPAANAPSLPPRKVPARFDDMIQQQAK